MNDLTVPARATQMATASETSTTSDDATPAEGAASAEETGRRRHFSRRRIAILGGAALLLLTAFTWGGLGSYIWGEEPVEKPPIVHAPPPEAPEETAEQREDRWRRDVIGRWHTYWKGDRYMTVREDGTATIEANLTEYNFAEILVVGTRKVTFEIEWSIEDGALTFDTVGGEPAGSVNVITSIHGKKKTYPIVHVTDDEFRYQSDDDDPDYIWTRLPAEGDAEPGSDDPHDANKGTRDESADEANGGSEEPVPTDAASGSD